MTPLAKVAWGLVIVIALIPVGIPAHPHPAWNFYHLLPPPVGWLIVYLALGNLVRIDTRFQIPRQLAIVAFVIAVPLWFPQINHLIDPTYEHGVSQSWQWLVALPTWVFGYAFSQRLGEAAAAHAPHDRNVTGWFGVLRWGFVLAACMPLLVYGAGWRQLDKPMQAVIAGVEIGLIVALFSYRRHVEFAGPGPRVWVEPTADQDKASGTRQTPTEWEEYKAERAKAREEMRERRRARRENAKRPE